MSQLVLDDQLDVQIILPQLKGWTSAIRLQEIRPGEQILDDRVPDILRALKSPTFITIDQGFWKRRLCHSRYCIIFFELKTEEQIHLPGLLRRLLRHPEFHTRARRMGKVARVRSESASYWLGGKKRFIELPDMPS